MIESPLVLTILLLALLFLFLLSGLPVGFTLIGISTVLLLAVKGPGALYLVYSIAFSTATKDIYLAIPFFVGMASILQVSGLGEALYDMMYKWFSGLRGGLAMGTIAICTLIEL